MYMVLGRYTGVLMQIMRAKQGNCVKSTKIRREYYTI